MPASDDMKPAGVNLTYDNYLLFPDDGQRHELIDGEHYATPTPRTRHQAIVVNLTGMIWNYLQEHPVGRVFTAPLDVILSNYDVVEPDLLYLSHERASEVLRDWVRGPPDLVVEIGSPGTRKRDETIKKRLYERFAVSEYWIVDPELDTVKVYRRTGERYTRVAELSLENKDVLTTRLLPGLEMPLSRIFTE